MLCVYIQGCKKVDLRQVKAGVAILLSEKFGVFLREWRCIDERITWIQIKIEGI